MTSELRLGVAAGEAGTAAVVMDEGGRVVADADVRGGPAEAIAAVLESDGVDPGRVTQAMLGAGRAPEALLERRAVTRVAVLRIGAPLTLAVPPLATWPDALRVAVSAGEAVVGGGAEYDGRSSAPLDADAVARFLVDVGGGAEAVAITGVFSPVAPDQELEAAAIVRRELGAGVHVSLSHQIGSVGLLERENATVLNAALVGGVRDLAAQVSKTLADAGIDADAYLAQNDGTLMALDFARRFPVLMVGSGPASSMRGAAHLTGLVDAVVVDAGGTWTDVGSLVSGFPRETARPREFVGVRIGFPMPDVRRLPFGADSVLDGDRLAEGIEWARGDVRSAPVVAVGAAAALIPDGFAGMHEVIRPTGGAVAGAIGAAIASVSGRADRICPDRPDERREALREARVAAFASAVQAGADPDAVDVVEVAEVPLSYVVDPVIRIRVKAAGPPDAAPLTPRAAR